MELPMQCRVGLAQRMLEDVDQRVLTVKEDQSPSSSPPNPLVSSALREKYTQYLSQNTLSNREK
jgi:hypothetical protein